MQINGFFLIFLSSYKKKEFFSIGFFSMNVVVLWKRRGKWESVLQILFLKKEKRIGKSVMKVREQNYSKADNETVEFFLHNNFVTCEYTYVWNLSTNIQQGVFNSIFIFINFWALSLLFSGSSRVFSKNGFFIAGSWSFVRARTY